MAATKLPISAIMSSSRVNSMANDRTMLRSKPQQRQTMSAFEARLSLVFALAEQSASLSQRVVSDLVAETAKYVVPKRFESRNLEEALMSVPDLESVNYKVLSRKDQYEIREVEGTTENSRNLEVIAGIFQRVRRQLGFRNTSRPYFIAETTMPGKAGFDFFGASQSFNVLAEYLFGKNMPNEKMEMTTPVITRRTSEGEKMEMTTPVITRKMGSQEKWMMSFVVPSKYGSDVPVPKDSAVKITEVPKKIVAVSAFSGYVNEEEVKQRESKLREALKNDLEFKVKVGAEVEVAQYNPPFTLPFTRRNEISLEVERKINAQ